MTAGADHEVRMLVDGTLIEADSGQTFDNVNPATEEVLGPVADASNAEMHRAIDAARRAFDETDWATNRDRRKECLSQLQEALEKDREAMREELIVEVGCPRMTTYANQLDIPLEGALAYPIKLIDEYPWRTELTGAVDRRGTANTRQIWKEPVGVVGAIVPWNFPLEVTLNKLGRRWPPATRSCSSRRRTRRGTPPAWAASWPSRRNSRRVCSTWSPRRITWWVRS